LEKKERGDREREREIEIERKRGGRERGKRGERARGRDRKLSAVHIQLYHHPNQTRLAQEVP
jgi:hypothetical protein